jgi:hypothetical protein
LTSRLKVRATTGHAAAAPPTNVMNSRRFIQSPRRRAQATSGRLDAECLRDRNLRDPNSGGGLLSDAEYELGAGV